MEVSLFNKFLRRKTLLSLRFHLFCGHAHTLSHRLWLSVGCRGFPVKPESKESALWCERLTTWVTHRCKSSLRQQWKHPICVTYLCLNPLRWVHKTRKSECDRFSSNVLLFSKKISRNVNISWSHGLMVSLKVLIFFALQLLLLRLETNREGEHADVSLIKPLLSCRKDRKPSHHW